MDIENLGWSSDWNGYEVGYPEIDVVGLYTKTLYAEDEKVIELNFYIDMDSRKILEMWAYDEDDRCYGDEFN